MRSESFNGRQFDVIVVGGGPAGASAAIRLAAGGARVAVLEQKKFPREKLCGEFISPECLEHFARLGVSGAMGPAGGASLRETVFYAASGRAVSIPSEWFARGVASPHAPGIMSSHAHGITSLHGRDITSSHAQGIAASSSDSGLIPSSCALGLSRAEMDARLLERAREAGASVFEEAHAAGVVREHGRVCGVRAQVRGEETTLHAPLTIDATGRTRALARRIERATRDDQERAARDDGERAARDARKGAGRDAGKERRGLVAFKAHLSGARAAEGACEIYFYRGGYGGLSSVERGLSNLCFIVAARDVRARASDAGRVMREVVMSNRRAAEALRGARVEGAWLAVALEGFGRFRVAPAPGLLAVGDAASFIDPFTGSGMLMALESGELAATVAARHLKRSDAPNDRLAASADRRAASNDCLDASGDCLAALAAEYRALYRERFGARLRVCSYLRRAAFAPSALVELGVAALSASAHARRQIARATRGGRAEGRAG